MALEEQMNKKIYIRYTPIEEVGEYDKENIDGNWGFV